jgi:hypothetical protein
LELLRRLGEKNSSEHNFAPRELARRRLDGPISIPTAQQTTEESRQSLRTKKKRTITQTHKTNLFGV